MKQFEKWAEGRGWRDKKGLFPPGMEDAWRACCEWMKKNASIEYDEYENPTGDLIVDGGDIEEELNS